MTATTPLSALPTTPRPQAHTAHSAPSTPAAGGLGPRLGYLLAGLPLGVAAFVTAVTGFAAGLGTLPIWLGLPILAATLAAARGFAALERRHVEAVTGRALPAPAYRARGGGVVRALSDPQSWRDFTHALVSFPLRIVTFSLALVWTVGGVGQLLYGLWSWPIPRDEGEAGLLDLMFDIDSRAADIAFHTAIGVVLLATAAPVLRALTAAQTSLARALLSDGRRPR
ncbi:sensor domain-containing protein [Streptomyces sp. 6N223]|uniref:sensor domain-containing protein n=1 Tax=Streptomyces sp. 6N223 TaxID=3457412 RepID=UPI003FD38961